MRLNCELKEIYKFIYKTKFENGLIEHEYDHILIGKSDTQPILNPEEADDWQWIDCDLLVDDIKNNPEKYTYWFRLALGEVLRKI